MKERIIYTPYRGQQIKVLVRVYENWDADTEIFGQDGKLLPLSTAERDYINTLNIVQDTFEQMCDHIAEEKARREASSLLPAEPYSAPDYQR